MHRVIATFLTVFALSRYTSAELSDSEASTLRNEVFDVLNDLVERQLGWTNLQEVYNVQAMYEKMAENGTAFVEKLAGGVSDRLNLRIKQLYRIHDAVGGLYKNPNSQPVQMYECCEVPESATEYNSRFRAKVGQECCMRSPAGKSDFNVVYNSEDGRIARDPRVKQAFLENFGESPEIKWQYAGANANGAYVIWPQKDRDSCDDYDPRFRPWYVEAASVPKNVVAIIDSSGSMAVKGRMIAAKNAARTVLSTLNPSDTFNVVDFDSAARTMSTATEYDSCFSSRLVDATPANINRLKGWISNLRDTGSTNFIDAFDKAFDIIESSFASNPELRKRPTVFLFLTDGDAADPIQRINVRKANLALDKFHIFTFALGTGVSSQSRQILERIASSTDGNFIQIGDSSDSELRSSMASYYSHPGLMKTEDESGVVLTVPYVDASGLGMVTTLAVPVMVDGSLVNVIGVDLTLNDLLDNALGYTISNDDSYVFIADMKGRVLAHPNLPQPDAYKDDPVFVFLDELERPVLESESFEPVLESMLRGETGKKHFSEIRRYIARGGDHEGTMEKYLSGTYYWSAASTTQANVKLIVGLFLADAEIETEKIADIPSSKVYSPYERIDLKHAPNMCTYYGNIVTFDHSSFALAPRLFKDANAYVDGKETKSGVELINALVHQGTPTTIGSNDLVLREAIMDARATALIDPFWKSLVMSENTDASTTNPVDEVRVLWRYIGTEGGLWRSYPAHPVSKAYNPTLRPWYRRSHASKDKITVSTPYNDASGVGMVLTLSKAVLSFEGAVMAVMGMDFYMADFKNLLQKATSLTKFDHAYLIDASGYIVADMDSLSIEMSGFYLGAVSLAANGLIEADVLQQETCANYETGKLEVHYSIKGFEKHMNAKCANGGSVDILPVPDSTVYIVIDNNCRPRVNQMCNTLKNTCLQSQIKSKSDICPCEADLGYYVCKQRFQAELFPGSLLAVCAPRAPALAARTKSMEEQQLLYSLSKCKQDTGRNTDPSKPDGTSKPGPESPSTDGSSSFLTRGIIGVATAVVAAVFLFQ